MAPHRPQHSRLPGIDGGFGAVLIGRADRESSGLRTSVRARWTRLADCHGITVMDPRRPGIGPAHDPLPPCGGGAATEVHRVAECPGSRPTSVDLPDNTPRSCLFRAAGRGHGRRGHFPVHRPQVSAVGGRQGRRACTSGPTGVAPRRIGRRPGLRPGSVESCHRHTGWLLSGD